MTHTPSIGGAERRARKRASSWSKVSWREDGFDIRRGVVLRQGAAPNLCGKEGGVSS